jgi:hypothetical protein
MDKQGFHGEIQFPSSAVVVVDPNPTTVVISFEAIFRAAPRHALMELGRPGKFKLSCCALSETRDWEHEGSFDMLAMVMASSQVANIRRFPEIKMLQQICQWTNASHLERYPKKTLMPYSNPGDVLNMSRNVEKSRVEQGGMVARS